MLTYLINTTEDMLAAAILIGLIIGTIDTMLSGRAKLFGRLGTAAGVIAAGIRAYITNTRRIEGGWKVGAYGYGITLGLFVLSVIAVAAFSWVIFSRKQRPKLRTAADIVISVSLSLLIAGYLYCMLPNIFVYPFKFDTGGNGILSTNYLFRLGGYLLGILLCLLSGYTAHKLCVLAEKKGFVKLSFAAMCLGNCLYSVFVFTKLMLVLTPRKIINSPELFKFAAESNNNAHWYTYGLFIIALVPGIVLFTASFIKKEPAANNAQRRKQRFLWRSARRHSVVLVLCFAAGILCSTLFVEMNKEVIREAPVEEPVIEKDSSGKDSVLSVPLELVEDGHLHRFGYKVEGGSMVRFIVVLKQENTKNYGVGLDACEICGEAGYYENNAGQIVCKKCNVIMNRTTIGMKGGCNPIIIDYDIDENRITVPVEEMVKNASHFK